MISKETAKHVLDVLLTNGTEYDGKTQQTYRNTIIDE